MWKFFHYPPYLLYLKYTLKKLRSKKTIASIRDSKWPCRQKIYRLHKAWDVLYGTVANSTVSAADFDTII